MRSLVLLAGFAALALATGCTSVMTAPRQLVIEKLWARHTVAGDYLGGRRIHRFTPILTDQLIVTANSIDGLVAYERQRGQVVWRLPIHDGVEAGAQLVGGTLYFGAGDGQLYAVVLETGRVLWTYALKAEGIAKPLVSGGVIYVLGGNNVAHAVDAKTGKLLWLYNRREASNLSVRGGSQPALFGELALVGFSDGALVALNRTSGALVWEVNLNRNKRFRDVDATPIIEDQTAYVSSYDGALYALNAAGGRILWTVEDGGYDEVLLQNNTLYYSASSGKTLALDKRSGKVLWSRLNPHGIATAPVMFKGTLIVGEMDGDLRFLDPRNGELLNSFAPGRGVTSKVGLDPKTNQLMFMSADANLYALNINWRRFAKEWPWE